MEGKGIMKITGIVKMSVCGLLGMVLTGCHEYQPPTSQFGTGRFFCYFQDDRTGHMYEGIADDQNDSVLMAKNACLNWPPKDLDHLHCQFKECVFK